MYCKECKKLLRDMYGDGACTFFADTYRFLIMVDGDGPYGVASVSGIRVESHDKIYVRDIEIRSAVYRGKEKKDLLFNAIVKKNVESMRATGKPRLFDIELISKGGSFEPSSVSEVLSMTRLKLSGCKLISYGISKHDASEFNIMNEKLEMSVDSLSYDYHEDLNE